MKTFQAILFDFDGVIAHTQAIMQQALWKFFRDRQMAVAESDFEEDGWASKSLAQVCELLAKKNDIHLDVNYLRGEIWEAQVKLIDAGLESDPTLIPFLEYCRQSNIRLAIGSNSIRDRIEWVIKKMGIDHYFLCDVEKPEHGYAIIGANDITKHKPDPEVWIKCAELFTIFPHQCLVIEDHLPGLTGAKQCGAMGIYYHHFCTPDKACMEIAEKSVENFSELLD